MIIIDKHDFIWYAVHGSTKLNKTLHLKNKYCIFEKKYMDKQLKNRITINPDICHGRPTIRNTRYTVDLLLDLLSSGMSEKEIIEDYPALEIKDIKACLAFASQLSKVKSVNRIIA